VEPSGKCSRQEDNHRLWYMRLPVPSPDRPVVSRGVSQPTLSIYLNLPVEVAMIRKPGEMLGEYVVRGQLHDREVYSSDQIETVVGWMGGTRQTNSPQ